MAPKVEEEPRGEAPAAAAPNGQQTPPPPAPPAAAAAAAAPEPAAPAAAAGGVAAGGGGASPAAPSAPTPTPPPPQPPAPVAAAALKRVVAVLPGKEELVAVTPNQRNWRGILIALLVIVAVLALIVFSIVLLSPPDEGPRVRGHKFKLDDVLSDRFRARRFNGSWVSDTELAILDVWGGVSVLNAENLTMRELVRNTTMRQFNADAFSVSGDQTYVLLESSEKTKVFARSYEARYFVCEVRSQQVVPLAPGNAPMSADEAPQLQLAVWSPAGSALAFVYRNDIYYRPRADAETVKVTHTGRPGVVFNGVPDWLYEEEVLQTRHALWFSPDGRALLFAAFNDSQVDELRFPWFGGGAARLTQYPELRSLRYPRAGRPNPAVTLYSVDLTTPQALHHIDLRPPKEEFAHDSGEHYVLAVSWAPQRQVAVVWANRRQNLTVLSLCNTASGICDTYHEEKAPAGGWASAVGTPLVAADGNSMLARLPVRDGDRGTYPHVCHVQVESRRVTPLTHGPFEVTRILRWDEDNHLVYFLAAPEWKPGQRHLYRVGDPQASDALRKWECITCPAPEPPRPRVPFRPPKNASREAVMPLGALLPPCLFADALFSPGASPSFAVVECLGPDVPVDSLADVARNFSFVSLLDWRDELRARWNNMSTPQVRTFQAEVQGGFHAQVRMYLPQGLREYEEMAFPLVLQVSAEPGQQLVSERWQVDWGTYLTSQRNFIVAQIDGRGSGFQGDRLRHQVFRHLGSVEIEDQIAIIAWIRTHLKYVDHERIGVWGWRYGGFAAAMILTQDEGMFRCGASVAPVSNWAEYDSAFTERYMGTPNLTDNYRGYDEADLTKHAGNLNEKMFLLIHGTADDTVHYQQSMLLVKALAKEGVIFRHQTYPDEGNSFDGVKSHLYKVLEGFFDDCFGPLDFAEWEVGTSFFTFKQ